MRVKRWTLPGGRVHSGQVLSIGEFSQLTHLSVRALRRFHEAGLLEPARIDGSSGYRYYTVDQIPAAQVIHRLRELDVPLTDVRRIVASDPSERADARRRSPAAPRVEAGPDPRHGRVAAAGCSQPEPVGLDIEVRDVPATTVAAIEDVVGPGRRPRLVRRCDGGAGRRGARAHGPAQAALYDNALFESGRGSLLVYRPATTRRVGRVHSVTLPAVELAVTTHHGEHHDIDVTYGRLGTWVVENSLAWGRHRSARPTSSAPRTPTTRPRGAPRSAGPCSGLRTGWRRPRADRSQRGRALLEALVRRRQTLRCCLVWPHRHRTEAGPSPSNTTL